MPLPGGSRGTPTNTVCLVSLPEPSSGNPSITSAGAERDRRPRTGDCSGAVQEAEAAEGRERGGRVRGRAGKGIAEGAVGAGEGLPGARVPGSVRVGHQQLSVGGRGRLQQEDARLPAGAAGSGG